MGGGDTPPAHKSYWVQSFLNITYFYLICDNINSLKVTVFFQIYNPN